MGTWKTLINPNSSNIPIYHYNPYNSYSPISLLSLLTLIILINLINLFTLFILITLTTLINLSTLITLISLMLLISLITHLFRVYVGGLGSGLNAGGQFTQSHFQGWRNFALPVRGCAWIVFCYAACFPRY